jgi:hypothetical protein
MCAVCISTTVAVVSLTYFKRVRKFARKALKYSLYGLMAIGAWPLWILLGIALVCGGLATLAEKL